MKTIPFAGLALACLSLGACSTLTPLTGNPAADAKAAVTGIGASSTDQLASLTAGLGKLTDTLNERCNGAIGLTWNPPLPPIPSVNVYCPIGQGTGALSMAALKALTTPAAVAPTSPVVPLSQVTPAAPGVATPAATQK